MTESTCIVEWCPRPPGGDKIHCKPHRDYVARKGRLPNRPSFYDERRRLWERIEVDAATGCWTWVGTLNSNGYGRVQFRGRVMAAHRAMWIRERGEIPPGLDLDHLCRNRRCTNPDHLEPVTREVNLRRGTNTRATDTHCANGHLWADDNERRHQTDGSRVCATCMRLSARNYQRRSRVAVRASQE